MVTIANMDKNKKEYTDFGYKEVPKKDKSKLVGEVFSSVASKYDLMNDVMSLGIHRLWKKAAIESSQVMPGNSVLDVAGGTGDLAIEFSKIVGSSGSVVLSDINEDMLAEGKKRVLDSGRLNVDFKIANAEELPFEKNSFDCISIAFGIRNVTDKEKALKSMFHCLKPGGRLIVLEFSKPTSNLFSQIYDIYSFNLLPLMGKLIADDADSYQYLAESIRKHPDQETFKKMMQSAGFLEASYENLTGGIVALHKGTKT